MASEVVITAEIEKKLAPFRTPSGLSASQMTLPVVSNSTPAKGKIHFNGVSGNTETAARNIEKHFVAKGMRGAPGGGGDADYIYVF